MQSSISASELPNECPAVVDSFGLRLKAPTMTDELKPQNIERLLAALTPRRQRFDFAYTMNRWVSEVRAYDDGSEPALSPGDGTNWDAIIPELFEPDPLPEPITLNQSPSHAHGREKNARTRRF